MSFTAASDYNRLKNKPVIPTKTSQLTNDSGFVTQSVRLDATRPLVVEVRPAASSQSGPAGSMWIIA